MAELAEALDMQPAALLAPARRLVALGRAELDWRTVERSPLAHRAETPNLRHELAEEQLAALDAIGALEPGHELLLQGVAASGKTDLYLAATFETLAAGRDVIVTVPEVSLVPQIGDRLRALIGDELGVLHSGLSAGERHDEWWRILRGEVRVVVGTRTAAFAPLARLGLIIVDEEHDGGYKSDRTPRYDARWVARRRAAITGARVILGSATPDLVSLARVRGGHAERAQLVERRVGATPAVEVADLRAELAGGNRSIFSTALADALGALRRGSEQAVLLLNRRGAATFILCRDCGESLRCPDCELPFVFHLDGGTLRCHHCGRSSVPTEKCPSCGSGRIRYFGAGTQRVEAELRARYPGLRIGRLDSDALAARRGFETIYDDFREGRTDVLVGTQLAAKGLDLPSVTLAGVIAADVTLNLPDYRAAERTFQLLAQVAGRAGRGPLPGRVIFQTYAPGHYAVRNAAALDVDGFADDELLRRRLLGYPPFSLLARLLIADADRGRAGGARPAGGRRRRRSGRRGARPAALLRRAARRPLPDAGRHPRAGRRYARGRPRARPAGDRHRRRPRVTPVIGTMPSAMAIRPILTADEPILRERTKRVSTFDASLHRLLDDMLVTMRDAPGVGLAANQIGVPLQVAIIEVDDKITELVNPQIVKGSGEQLDWEGCLSIPGYVAEVTRHEKVTVKARDRHGKEFRVKGTELLARALQHEIDHLNGTLYIDHLESLEELVRVSESTEEVTEEAAAGI